MQQPQQPHPAATASPLLAVWACPGLNDDPTEPLSDPLCQRLIEHYSDPGNLILTQEAGRQLAARLGRRALPLNPLLQQPTPGNGGARDRALRRLPSPAAQLILLAPGPETNLQPERIRRLLAPGGFLVLAPPASGRPQLGETIGRWRRSGLRYWQHLIAFDPNEPTRTKPHPRHGHRDLLVFHQPRVAFEVGATGEAAA